MNNVLAHLSNYLNSSSLINKDTNIQSFLIKSWLFIFSIKILSFLIVFVLRKTNLVVIKNVGLSNWANDSNIYVFIFQVLIIAPIMEELLFRGILKDNIYLLSISVAVFVFFSIKIYYHKSFYDLDEKFVFAFTASLIVMIGMIILCNFTSTAVIITSLYSSKTYLLLLIAISSLLFALLHCTNFNYRNISSISLILALLPHFISGIVYSIICLKYGIGYSILLHISVNLFPVMLTAFEKKPI